jgi:hypothetical protein
MHSHFDNSIRSSRSPVVAQISNCASRLFEAAPPLVCLPMTRGRCAAPMSLL